MPEDYVESAMSSSTLAIAGPLLVSLVVALAGLGTTLYSAHQTHAWAKEQWALNERAARKTWDRESEGARRVWLREKQADAYVRFLTWNMQNSGADKDADYPSVSGGIAAWGSPEVVRLWERWWVLPDGTQSDEVWADLTGQIKLDLGVIQAPAEVEVA